MPILRQSELSDMDKCPRLYFFNWIAPTAGSIDNVHTKFGTLVHLGIETYYKLKARRGHNIAVRVAVKRVLRASYGFVGENPKTRYTLLRTVVFYTEHYKNQKLDAKQYAGQAFVEYRLELDTQIPSFNGESWLISCGLDRVMEQSCSNYIMDIKTTKMQLDDRYFAAFKRDVQTFTYTLAGNTIKDPPEGLMIEGIQLLVNDTRFQRRPIDLPTQVVDDWAAHSLPLLLSQLNQAFTEGIWPQHLSSCNGRYGPCPHFDTCHMTPYEIEESMGCSFKQATTKYLEETNNKEELIDRS